MQGGKMKDRKVTINTGIVIRRQRGVTRWAHWIWRPVAVIPGASSAEWQVLRQTETYTDYHAATLPLTLYRTDTEAYRIAIMNDPPSVYVVLRDNEEEGAIHDVVPWLVTASPYEAQDYLDSGEEIVEPVVMPDSLIAMIRDFIDTHHVEVPFIKRKRDRKRLDLIETGVGDERIRQTVDVYRAPGDLKRRLH